MTEQKHPRHHAVSGCLIMFGFIIGCVVIGWEVFIIFTVVFSICCYCSGWINRPHLARISKARKAERIAKYIKACEKISKEARICLEERDRKQRELAQQKTVRVKSFYRRRPGYGKYLCPDPTRDFG